MNATPAIHHETVSSRSAGNSMAMQVGRALHWLESSGIVISDTTHADYGAVYSFYDARSKRYRLVYAEATGYLLSFCKYLRATHRDVRWDTPARAAASWLVRSVDRSGSILMGIDEHGPIRRSYAFDNGICAKGLLDAYEVTNDSTYLETARRVLDRLVGASLNGDGSVTSAVDLDSGRFLNTGKAWYETSGSFHAKISMPLLHLSARTGDTRWAEAARRICTWTLRQQSPDGSFPANMTVRAVNLHAHCYVTEAFLYAYAMTREPAFRSAAEKAIRWILNRQAANGSLRLWHGGRMLRRRASYAMAQSLRLFLLLYALTREDPIIEAAMRTAAFLGRMQASDRDPRINGGFYAEDIMRSGLLIRMNREVTSWATMFAVQALDLFPRIRSVTFEQCMAWLF
jgi:uncharacterized protein YyaL (SSP411 family)